MACHGIFAKRKVAPELMMQVTQQRDFHAFRAIQKLCNHAVNYWAAERTGEENLFMTGFIHTPIYINRGSYLHAYFLWSY